MKILHLFILLFITTLMLCGCSADPETEPTAEGKVVSISLNISSSGKSVASRAYGAMAWDDANAVEGEMMKNCFVVIVQGGYVKKVLISGNYAQEKSMETTLTTKINAGTTTFYSFANMTPEDVGLSSTTDYTTTNTPLPSGFDSQLHTVNGNVMTIADFPNGIPMSNKQTVDISVDKQKVDLEVIRMVAKMKLNITNETTSDITLKGVSMSDITTNETNNLYLLPGNDNGIALEPHINPMAKKATYKLDFATPIVVKAKNATPVEVGFYINESEASSPNYFVIGMATDHATMSHRGAMSKWNTISRNDYLVVPIKLNDYIVNFDVQQFTAIGVLPSIEQNNETLTVKFKGYGEFHIIPHVIRISDGAELTAGSATAGGWTFKEWKTIEKTPDGGEGTCIYDRMPAYVESKRRIEGVVGPRNGNAIHQFVVSIGGVGVDIPYKVQIIKE